MQTSSTDLPLTVARVDQLSRVAKSKRVEADPDPGGDESHKEEKAGHVCAAPLRVGTLVRGIVGVCLIFVLIPAATTFSHSNLKQRLKLCCVNAAGCHRILFRNKGYCRALDKESLACSLDGSCFSACARNWVGVVLSASDAAAAETWIFSACVCVAKDL